MNSQRKGTDFSLCIGPFLAHADAKVDSVRNIYAIQLMKAMELKSISENIDDITLNSMLAINLTLVASFRNPE